MSIVDKLGITKAPWIVNDYYTVIQNSSNEEELHSVCGFGNSKRNTANMDLIKVAPEMLEALIDDALFLEMGIYQDRFKNKVKIVEKATNKSWEEIKEMLK